MNENGEIELTVDGIDYTVMEDGDNAFTIFEGDENFAEITLSVCCEYYEYEYSPLYSNFDDSGGQSHIGDHDGILEFFRWVIGANA